jgi:hypothetical protein
MKCAGCNRDLEVGDLFIKDTASGFIGRNIDPVLDGVIADILGGADGEVVYCEDCTQEGGDYRFDTYYGEDENG